MRSGRRAYFPEHARTRAVRELASAAVAITPVRTNCVTVATALAELRGADAPASKLDAQRFLCASCGCAGCSKFIQWLGGYGPAPVKAQPRKRTKAALPTPPGRLSRGFYDSREWLTLRFFTLKKYGRACMLCKTTAGQMHVDHIRPRSLFPDLELDPDNLQVLCRDCNLGKSNLDDTDFRDV